ncbi:MAG: hypothetical protein H0U95_14435 [Bacteroidetes bacterium]|nr:hypothetical protein [Bacteroidota bacterium]
MNSEKDFKDALKAKLNEKHFQFDEAGWEKASQMLDASREEKKRPFPFLLLSGILVLVSVIGFYIFKPVSETSAKEIAVANTGANNAARKQILTGETTSFIGSNKNSASISKETDLKTSNETEKSINNSTEKITTAYKINVKAKNTKTKKSRQVTGKTKKENKVNENNLVAVTPKKEKSRNTVSKNNFTTQSMVKHDNEETVKNETVKVKTNNTIPEANHVLPSEVTPQKITPVTTLNNNTIDSVKNTIAATETPKKDSLPKPVVKEPVHFISFEAGTNYLFGWNNPGKKDANGFNLVVGLNYSNIVTKKINFSIGIHYTTVRNLSYSNYTVKTTRYNFGEESDVMVFTPTTLHYLVTPIRVSYALDARNVFGLACNVGYLFNVNSNVELYSQTANQKSSSTVLRTSGYLQGFKTIDTQLSVFYRRNLSKDLCLHTEFMYGMSDVKNNAFFSSSVKEKNVGFKFTLIYNLFKK